MDLAHFRLNSATFEVRYEHAYLLWDHAGQFWYSVSQAHPGLKVIEAGPGRVVGAIGAQHQVSLEVSRLAIDFYPIAGQAEGFAEFCNEMFTGAASVLRLSILTRVGLRLVYRQVHRSREEAAKSVINTGMLRAPTGVFFGVQGQFLQPWYSIKLQSDRIGVQITLRAQERKIVVEPPLGERLFERLEREEFECDYDIDYYTEAPVNIHSFRVTDWMTHAMRIIRRDSKEFLGG